MRLKKPRKPHDASKARIVESLSHPGSDSKVTVKALDELSETAITDALLKERFYSEEG